jgi:hypothetical protein
LIMMFRVGVVAAGLLIAALAGPAQAAPEFFAFNLTFNSGPLNGQRIGGNLSVDGNDCPSGICVGNFDPTNVARTLLSLNITVGGVPFAMNNDTGFGLGAFPDVTFGATGQLSQIDYQGQVNSGGHTFVLDMTGVNVGVDLAAFYQGTVGNVAPGTLVSTAIVRQVVPEPGTVSLLGVALIGMAFAWRRKTSARHTLTDEALAA